MSKSLSILSCAFVGGVVGVGVNVKPLLSSSISAVVSVRLLKLWIVKVDVVGCVGFGIKNDH